ncbi:MAG: flagellar basal body P-ring protein FlgI [Rhodothalassiaceae bacterium]
MALFLLASLFLPGTDGAEAASRIKDLVNIEGVRENQLVGYGLVVGLDDTGDTLRNAPFTQQSIEAMLERLGINTRNARNMVTGNVAAVMVTADLPAFARHGSRIDVQVSSMGDAEDLRGGTLLVTPLYGADGEVYAVAQGPIAVAGFAATGAAASITQGVPTSGRIASGAIVEREVDFDFRSLEQVRLALKNPDLTTASRIAEAINAKFADAVATMLDPGTVLLRRPPGSTMDVALLLTETEQLLVEPDTPAKVVIDDRSGIIVMGANVRVSTVAIAQGNLTIRITETPVVSQPQPFSEQGQTAVVPRSNVEVDTGQDNRLAVVEEGVTLQDLVDGLNALGIGPRDMISILQAIRAAGALQADIEVI